MNVEYHRWFSNSLQQNMEMKVYGSFGKPVLVFPCAGGRFFEFEDFKMLEAVSPLIEGGQIKVFTVDSVDNQTWLNAGGKQADRARRHNEYDQYIVKDVVPFIHNHQKSNEGILVTGCSLGAFQSVNFFLRHPDVFTSVIALSGVYSLTHFVGDHYNDDQVYFNSPIDYLPNLRDDWFLHHIRHGKIILCCGQGAWEDEALADTRRMQRIFEEKQIPAWVDLWGRDASHDWPWWRQQLPLFLGHLLK